MPVYTLYLSDGLHNQQLLFNSTTSELMNLDYSPVDLSHIDDGNIVADLKIINPISKDNPGKKNHDLKTIKIQLGLGCNYGCSYCNQRFHDDEYSGNIKTAEKFINNIKNWYSGGIDGLGKGTVFELWGGEPFLYWKKLKMLVQKLHKIYPNAEFFTVTNGSLLTPEIVSFLLKYKFSIGISHDGPGQSIRGDDPLDNPVIVESIRRLHEYLHPQKLKFTCVLTKNNASYKEIRRYICNKLGINDIILTSNGLIRPYGKSDMKLVPNTIEEKQKFSWKIIEEILDGEGLNVPGQKNKLDGFILAIKQKINHQYIPQLCQMDDPHNIAVDLHGNVLTCHHVNNDYHKIGHVNKFENIKLNTVTHWKNRESCLHCPVINLCSGSCMYLHGNEFAMACDAAFTYNMALFTAALYFMTGKFLIKIEGDMRRPKIDKISSIPVMQV